MNIKIEVTYKDEETEERTVFDADAQIGYFIIEKNQPDIEVYHCPQDNDFTSIDYVESAEEAIELIMSTAYDF